MDFIGFWKFHSIGTIDEKDRLVYLSAEEYINSDMPYIDTSDPEAVEDEMKGRRGVVGAKLKFTEDGKFYTLMPLPEGVSQAEVDEAVKDGIITLMDGMICGDAKTWELRDGELWFDTGIEGEILGEKTDGFAKAMDSEGYISFMTTRFVKE